MRSDNKAAVSNRKAFRDYHIDKTYEAGMELQGGEVKSLRAGKGDLKGSFAKLDDGELFLYKMHINPYEYAQEEYDPERRRKLLLHKAEITQLAVKFAQKGFTLVPLKVYFRRGYAKVEIGLGRGKKLYDKRKAVKEESAKKEMKRAASYMVKGK